MESTCVDLTEGRLLKASVEQKLPAQQERKFQDHLLMCRYCREKYICEAGLQDEAAEFTEAFLDYEEGDEEQEPARRVHEETQHV